MKTLVEGGVMSHFSQIIFYFLLIRFDLITTENGIVMLEILKESDLNLCHVVLGNDRIPIRLQQIHATG